MCGQAGIIFGRKRRSREEIDHLTSIFTDLLVLSQKRGRHATGVAWLNRHGGYDIHKRPVPAEQFVKHKKYRHVLQGVGSDTTILMGHTRWKTRGDEHNNLNNHPIETTHTIGTHNGTIINADYLFWRCGLPRQAEVDSEVIFRLADRTLDHGRYEIPALVDRLSLCKGEMSAVMASKADPETIIVVKGDKPLELRYHRGYRALLYASGDAILDAVLAGQSRWMRRTLSPSSVATVSCRGLKIQHAGSLSIPSQGKACKKGEILI